MLAPVGVSLGFFDDARAVAQLADITGEPGRTLAAAARASHLVDFLRIIGVMSRLAEHAGAVTVGARIRHETGHAFPTTVRSDHETSQSQIRQFAEKQLSLNRLEIVHG
jgi:hypothetical protein